MPLFKEVNTLEIVYRQYEYNTEVLDGLLDKIDDVEQCVVLRHDPNVNWGYNIVQVKKGYADLLWKELGSKLEKKSSIPKQFLNMILVKDLEEYIQNNNYTLVKTVEISNVKKEDKVSAPFANIKLPNKSTLEVTSQKAKLPDLDIGYFKLTRDSEAPTYIFKSPNLR